MYTYDMRKKDEDRDEGEREEVSERRWASKTK
jgi:hypothetical protein